MITVEKLRNHQQVLQERHDALDKAIERHYSRYDSDDKVKAEKIEKLKLKQEIENINRKIETLETTI